ncbi:unnamed protein product, partial [Symbiodinium pilosum]
MLPLSTLGATRRRCGPVSTGQDVTPVASASPSAPFQAARSSWNARSQRSPRTTSSAACISRCSFQSTRSLAKMRSTSWRT